MINKNIKLLAKLCLLLSIFSFSSLGFAGMFDLYDPYYGRLATQSPGCYRPCVETLDRCDCACNVDQCKCVRSVTTFERRYADPPYQPRSELYVNVFSGMF